MAFLKKSFVFGVISFATMGLVACGESSDSKGDASGVVDIIDESKAELSDGEVVTCDSELEGAVAAIVTGGFRRCEDGAWVKISRAEALDADKILGMGGVSSALSSSSLDVSSSSSWSGAIGSTEDSEKGSTDFVVDREKDMPVCSAKREGKTIYVEELDETFVCSDFEWVKKGASSLSSSSALSSSSWSEAIGSSDSDPVTELYKCPNGQYADTKEECPSSSSNVTLSSSTTSSSSSTTSSSSWSGAIGSKPAWQYLNPSIDYGTMIDTRDGQVYKTIKICDKNDKNCQTWMAENLNYAPTNVSSMGSDAWSGCYDNESANCSKYGRLYTWEVAMNDADCAYGKTCNAPLKPATPVRGVCPSGWHLPSHYEFEELINFIDPTFGYGHTDEASSSTAGKYLKSQFSWNSSGNGTDFYGFSALPGGYRDYDGDFYSAGIYALFWSSGEYGSDYALYLGLRYDYETADLFGTYKNFARSVRCLKDIPDQGGEISSSSGMLSEQSSSSMTLVGSSNSVDSPVKPSGYYKTNCPAGLTCKYAATTDYLNSSKTYGEILDTRDGQVYKTIEICDEDNKNCQTWMAQNLNYGDVVSWCGGGSGSMEGDCSIYGRLYTWEVAMDKSGCGYGNYCNNSNEGTQGVCPSGWHLPTKEEWQKLVKPMANSVEDYTTYWYYNGAGIELKTVDDWNEYSSSTKGTNTSGFSALPAGLGYRNGSLYNAGLSAYFWSASEGSGSNACRLFLSFNNDFANLDYNDKGSAFSVRCVQNN